MERLDGIRTKGGAGKSSKTPEQSMLHIAVSIPAGPKAVRMRAILAQFAIENVSEYVWGLVEADLNARFDALEALTEKPAPEPGPEPEPEPVKAPYTPPAVKAGKSHKG